MSPYDRPGRSKIKVVCQKFYRACMHDFMVISVATLVGHLQFPHIQIGCYNNSENAVTGVTALPALYQLY